MKFDQHFMQDDSVLNTIVKASKIKAEDHIIEIGPGPGYLTTAILERSPKKLVSIELDLTFERDLEAIKGKYFDTFSYEIGNALEIIDWIQYHKLVANIPYSITEPLYTKLIEHDIAFAVMLHGKNFYKLITEEQSPWYYFINAYYDVELVQEVPGELFEPKTNVTSVIVKLVKKHKRTKFEEFCYQLFTKRKRSVKNAIIFALVDSLDISKKDARDAFNTLESYSPDETIDTMNHRELSTLIAEIKNFIEKL